MASLKVLRNEREVAFLSAGGTSCCFVPLIHVESGRHLTIIDCDGADTGKSSITVSWMLIMVRVTSLLIEYDKQSEQMLTQQLWPPNTSWKKLLIRNILRIFIKSNTFVFGEAKIGVLYFNMKVHLFDTSAPAPLLLLGMFVTVIFYSLIFKDNKWSI